MTQADVRRRLAAMLDAYHPREVGDAFLAFLLVGPTLWMMFLGAILAPSFMVQYEAQQIALPAATRLTLLASWLLTQRMGFVFGFLGCIQLVFVGLHRTSAFGTWLEQQPSTLARAIRYGQLARMLAHQARPQRSGLFARLGATEPAWPEAAVRDVEQRRAAGMPLRNAICAAATLPGPIEQALATGDLGGDDHAVVMLASRQMDREAFRAYVAAARSALPFAFCMSVLVATVMFGSLYYPVWK